MPAKKIKLHEAPPPPSTPYPLPHYPPQFYPPSGYPPPPYPSRNYLPHPLPAQVVDKMLPKVPFAYRPLALKYALALLITGTILCIGFVILIAPNAIYSIFSVFVLSLLLVIGILGMISFVLLMIPKKIGWNLALVTAILGLLGLGPGTIISIFVIVALFWPSTRYYFRTGQPMPLLPVAPYPYPPY